MEIQGMQTTIRSLLVIGLIALLAACSSGATTTTAPATAAAPSVAAPTEAPSAAAPTDAPSAAATDATVTLVDNALGKILVGADGMTLYAFTPDTAGTSTCYDACAAAWPALVTDGAAAPTAGDGLDASKLTTTDRTDGTKQVKYGDWPLYYFASDTAAGDTNGQGVGGKWFVIDATGALIGQ
jgi:predicted lipoprotein with Yx(FWY)xxD motif